MHCIKCGKKNTKNRIIDSVTKICSECVSTSNGAAAVETVEQVDEDATMSSIKFSDFKQWMQSELKPIHEEIKSLKESAEEIEKQKGEIVLLKSRCDENEETIEALKSIVAKQQKSLCDKDSEIREKNIIISGISESDIQVEDQRYTSDDEKVKALFGVLGTPIPQGFTIQRLGKPNERYARAIKLNVVDKSNRNTIMKKSRELKEAAEPWKKVYINHDLHPAMVEENKRLRKKKKALQSLEENKEKEIKIEKGELKVDGEVVDSNLLFR